MNLMTSGFGSEEARMQAYFAEGERRALALDNRGPLKLTGDGQLDPAIVDSYRRHGFYIFEGFLSPTELAEAQADLDDMLDRLPTERDSPVDHKGRPALGVGNAIPAVTWSKPLGDPLGGTGLLEDRAPVKMVEVEAAKSAPKETVYGILSPLQFSDAMLRMYGHPGLLAIAETINGPDFTPFTETIIVKKPGEGGAFAWHQDGTTHWDSENWNPDVHGFNFMVQFNRCTAANAIWFVPGSHAQGKVDIRQLVADSGGNCLHDAVPLICNPGDGVVSNRQIVHGSFPNTSRDLRISLTLGFLPRTSVIGVSTKDAAGQPVFYDDARVDARCEIIAYAIDARRQHFAGEKPFIYQPLAGNGALFQWGEDKRSVLQDYRLKDLFI